MPTDSSPNIEDSIGIYLHVWDIFGEDPFDSDEMVEQFVKRDIRQVTGEDGPNPHLDMLVEQGLLEWNDGQYRVRCTPEEDLSAWREQIRSPEAIYQLVQQAKRQWDSTSGDDSLKILDHGDETFVSIPADKDTTLSALEVKVADRLGQPPAYDGIVLRSPGSHAGYVQQLADELGDAQVMAASDFSYQFEKIASSVRGEHKDDLEYRLYLRANH